MLTHKKDIKSTILNFLYASKDFEKAVQETIQFIGETYNMSRVYIFENSEDDVAMNNTFEWCNQGISPQKDNLQNVKYVEDLGGAYEQNFDENGMFFCPDISLLPKEQYDVLAPQGIKGMLQCSIVEDGKFKGMIGYDDCNEYNREWHKEPDKIETLVFMAHTLSLYLLKERHLTKLYDERVQLHNLIQKAQVAEEAKSRFLSSVSHDMRTPLNGILGLVDMLNDKIHDDKNMEYFKSKPLFDTFTQQLEEDLTQLKSSGKYLLNLINDTLDISKMENGTFALNPRVVRVEDETNSFLNVAKNLCIAQNIQMNVHYANISKGFFFIDPIRAAQIFFNIISNSLKFSHEGGSIDVTIDTFKEDDAIVYKKITIQDYGVGMDKAFIDKIFVPFEREEKGNVTFHSGTGLGMSIVKQIIDSMKGSISIQSEKNKGTLVTVILPLPHATKEQMDISEYALCTANAPNFTNLRVLLFEDNKVNAKVAVNYLSKKGFQIDVAQNGQIGLDMFIASPHKHYDFILMDIQMPVMDGLQATKAIRNSKHTQAKSIPIIALSANIMEDEKQEALLSGMNAYISKPINVVQLFSIIQKELAL